MTLCPYQDIETLLNHLLFCFVNFSTHLNRKTSAWPMMICWEIWWRNFTVDPEIPPNLYRSNWEKRQPGLQSKLSDSNWNQVWIDNQNIILEWNLGPSCFCHVCVSKCGKNLAITFEHSEVESSYLAYSTNETLWSNTKITFILKNKPFRTLFPPGHLCSTSTSWS